MDDELVIGFEPKKTIELDKRIKLHEFTNDRSIDFYTSENGLMFGCVQYQHYSIHVGPVLTMRIKTNDHYKKIAKEDLQYDGNIENVRTFFNKCNTYDIKTFTNILITIYESLHHKKYNENIIQPYSSQSASSVLDGDKLETIQVEWFEINRKNIQDIEYCIQNGLVDEVKKLGLFVQNTNNRVFGDTELKELRNVGVIFIYVCINAAITGGINVMVAGELYEKYISKLDTCQDFTDMKNLMTNMKMELCTRVSEQTIKHVGHPTIRKIKKYITNNILEKITVESIANTFHMSKEYLSSLFIKETGMSIPSYVNHEKVRVAKKMLALTDLSLIYISNYLSFSSQSYFHKVFKDIEGITPKEYRDKIKSSS